MPWLVQAETSPTAAQNTPSAVTPTLPTKASWEAWLAKLPKDVRLVNGELLRQLYLDNNMTLFWQDLQARYLFEQQLAEVALAGIHPQFLQWAKELSVTDRDEVVRDLLLSDAFLAYSHFVAVVPENGRRWLYGFSRIASLKPSLDSIERWQQALHSDTLETYLLSLAPQHSQYRPMRAALITLLQTVDNQPWPKIASGPSLKQGSNSHDIIALREILNRTGMLHDQAPIEQPLPIATTLTKKTVVDDSDEESATRLSESDKAKSLLAENQHYDQTLVEAVKRFQQSHGLQADGVIGKQTRQWLNTPLHVHAGLLALNLQRLRLLPDKIDEAILVNIADYSLVFYQNRAPALLSRVIVGSPKRKTPLMDNSLLNVVINPPWNVPTKLIKEDIIPKIKRDPAYLQQMNYTLYAGWQQDSQVIDPNTIDWPRVSAKHFPYSIRQAPGSHNALGRYKFNMPNSEAIYLHDTPNQNLFNKDIRAFSSGCVRVNKAAELASILLNQVGWKENKIAATLQQGKTTYVPIRQRIPVKLYYLTAWVNDNAIAQYRTDIYDYDSMVNESVESIAQIRSLIR